MVPRYRLGPFDLNPSRSATIATWCFCGLKARQIVCFGLLPGNGRNHVPDGVPGTHTPIFQGGQSAIPDFVSDEDQIDPSGFFGSDTDPAFLTLLDDLTGVAGIVSMIDPVGSTLRLMNIRANILQAPDYAIQ